MRIHFLGATRTTTGSLYLFELNGQKLLLECGLFQGRRGESTERNRNFPFDPKRIDAVVLSRAHIDHCGNLPNLCRQGFQGNIYCTFATRDLASIMLEDWPKSNGMTLHSCRKSAPRRAFRPSSRFIPPRMPTGRSVNLSASTTIARFRWPTASP